MRACVRVRVRACVHECFMHVSECVRVCAEHELGWTTAVASSYTGSSV